MPTPRIAVWCPQGREKLPLAAEVCLRRLCPEQIIWWSEETSPGEPVGVEADVWLVLCADAPPSAPVWREKMRGAWVMFPGPAERWSEDTRTAIAAWRCDRVLSDLLPDETVNSVWHGLWSDGTLRWLPAVAPVGIDDGVGDSLAMVFAIGHGLPETEVNSVATAFAAVTGARIVDLRSPKKLFEGLRRVMRAEKVVLCTTDPVLAGMVQRVLVVQRGRLALWGVGIPEIRRRILGGPKAVVAVPAGFESSLRGPLRRITGALFTRGEGGADLERVEVPDFDWLEAILAPLELAAEPVRNLAKLQDAERAPCWSPLVAEWPGSVAAEGCMPYGLALPGTSAETLWRYLESARVDGASMALVSRFFSVFPSRLAEFVDWATTRGAGNAGWLILFGCADGHAFGERRVFVEAARAILRVAGRRADARTEWMLCWAVAESLLGALDVAEEPMEALWTRDRGNFSWALSLMVRGWLPLLTEGDSGLAAAALRSRWEEWATRWAAAAGAPGWLLGARGLVVLGAPEIADAWAAKPAQVSPEALAPEVLVLWLMGRRDQAARWWGRRDTQAASDNPLARFWVCCANVLVDGQQQGGRELLDLVCTVPEIVAFWRPSGYRLSLLAAALQHSGLPAEADRWLKQAREWEVYCPGRESGWKRCIPSSRG